jgi:hypothetical protein
MKTVGLGTIIGAIVGLIMPAVLGYRTFSEKYIFSLIVCAIAGACVSALVARRSNFEPKPPTRKSQSRFVLFLIVLFIFNLIRGTYLIAIFFGLAAIGAWYSLQQMGD